MAPITWDALEDRTYEEGVDRGVLYPVTSQGVPWNGLVSVNEKNTAEAPLAHIFDGVKFFEQARAAKFEATLTAFTYPLEFEECDGSASYDGALLVAQQQPRAFGLSYRTRIGSYDDPDFAYRLHIIYNALAQPTDRNQDTRTSTAAPSLFSWDITTTPVESLSLYPSAHFVVDSRFVEPANLQALEDILYGATSEPRLPTVSELRTYAVASNDPWRFDPTRGSVFKKEFGKFRTKPIDILAVGDSVTEGYGATSIANRWENKLATTLRGLLGQKKAGEGYVPSYYEDPTKTDRFTGGTYTVSGGLFGLGLRVLRLTGGTLSFTFQGTGCDIIMSVGTAAGQFAWNIDGGAYSANIATYSATNEGGWCFISPRNLASGSHTINIQWKTATVYIEGAMVYDGDENNGVRVVEAAHSSYQAYSFGSFNPYWARSITPRPVAFVTPPGSTSRVDPAVAFLFLGLNDYATGSAARRTAAQFKADMKLIVSYIRDNTAVDPSMVLIIPPERTTTGTLLSTWAEYRTAYFEVATEEKLGVIDLKKTIGSFVGGDPNGYSIGDGLHLSDKGLSVVAKEAAKMLFTP